MLYEANGLPRLLLDQEAIRAVSGMLQAGFQVEADPGLSVRDFLIQVLGLDPAYVEERLRTIFVNGKPVDDIDAARVSPGDVMCLSAALPGAAGICMRRNSPYAALRGDITHGRASSDGAVRETGRGLLTVKLFNQTLLDLGPDLLRRGVILPWARLLPRLADLAVRRPDARIAFDGRDTPLAELAARQEAAPGELIRCAALEQ